MVTSIVGLDKLLLACAEHDGLSPLNEEALLRIGEVGEQLIETDDAVVGYGTINRDGVIQLVVHPRFRCQGLASQMFEVYCTKFTPTGIWSFGNLPAAQAFAAAENLQPTRNLLKLRLPAATQLKPAPLHHDYEFFTYQEDPDLEAITNLNAKAFSWHPEQGSLTLADLRERTEQRWFNPELLLLVRECSSGDLAGFCWGKVDAGESEMYVLAVDPDHGGKGIGKALTATMLRSLRGEIPVDVGLYVDEENTSALRLYQAAGFEESRRDVFYALPS